MKIKWLGHSCFLLSAENGATLLTDPYDTKAYPGTLLYRPLDETPGLMPDVVTISHAHADHGNAGGLAGHPEIIRAPQPHQVAGFSTRGVECFHDSELGARRGEIIVFIIEAGDIRVCHLGDLGHELTAEQVEAIGEVDVLLIPVGGIFTIDAPTATRVWQQLMPPVTIPMHYRNDKCLFKIDGVDRFLAGKPQVETPGASEIELKKDILPAGPKIFLLEHAN